MKDSVAEKNNPLGISGDRSKWASKLTFDEEADYIFFAGCGYQTMKYTMELMNAAKGMKKFGMDMNKTLGFAKIFKSSHIDVSSITAKVLAYGKSDSYSGILVDAVNVLQKLDVKMKYLGASEPCCGSPLYYSGFVHDFKKNAEKFCETIKPYGIRNIISMIPACTYSLRSYHAEFVEGFDFEIKHFVEIVHDRLQDSDVKLRLPEKVRVTYHDPCQLSRYLNIVDEPRAILSNIDGLEFVEPEPDQTGKWSTCCGGGGGLEVSAPELSDQVAKDRVEQLKETGASIIVTSCPFCLMQLRKGVQKLNADIQVIDMAQLLAMALDQSESNYERE
jgi:Fe-S oxidoreductase